MLIFKILIKNAFRRKLRTSLTILGLAIAILSFGFLRTVINAWYAGVEASSANRLITRNAVSLIFPLPISYKERIRQINGVKDVSYGSWFGGVYIDKKNFFPNFAVEPENYLKIYKEFILPEDQRIDFLKDRRGFVAGRKLVAKYGWKIGDLVTLQGTIFPGDWQLILRGVYRGKDKSTDENQFFFHWNYLNENLKKTSPLRADQVGYYVIELTEADLAGQVSMDVDAIFKNSRAETLTETEKAFQQSFVAMSEAIVITIQVVSFMVIIIIMAVVANTMAMTTRERIGEYAVLKTLGFSGRRIAILIFGESLVIAFIGCLLGIVLTFPAAKVFSKNLSTFFPVFNIETKTVCLDIIAAFWVGIIAAVIPTLQAIKIRIADGLRRIG